jgi:DNA-binding NarL/FixJ family response regulator
MGEVVIRVGVVDDHAILRRSLRRLIDSQPDMSTVGEAGDGRGAIDLVGRQPVDVLMLDLVMPGIGGMDALGMIRAKAPHTGVLVLSSSPEEHYGPQLAHRGARGFLNKQVEPEEIPQAIRTVAVGGTYFRQAVAEVPPDPYETLSDREFQLLLHLARGEGTHEIARVLSLSPQTTSTYRTALLGKLGLRTNSELTHYALAHGLID